MDLSPKRVVVVCLCGRIVCAAVTRARRGLACDVGRPLPPSIATSRGHLSQLLRSNWRCGPQHGLRDIAFAVDLQGEVLVEGDGSCCNIGANLAVHVVQEHALQHVLALEQHTPAMSTARRPLQTDR